MGVGALSGHDICSSRAQCSPVGMERMVAIHRENQVISLSQAGKILFRIVYNLVCAERANHFCMPRTANGGDFRAECSGKLHGEGSHTTRCTLDQYFLSGLNFSAI